MKNLQFVSNFSIFDNFNDNFASFLKIYRIFRENLVKIEKIEKLAFVGGSGLEPRVDREFMKNGVQKSMKTCNFLKIFIN